MIYLIAALLAGLAIWGAARGVQRQIAAEKAQEEAGDPTRPWRGAKVYGTGFETGLPPAEQVVRATWTPIYVPSETELSRGSGFPPESTFHARTLKSFCDWCQESCAGAWLGVVPEGGQPTFWFANDEDSIRFASTWFPYKCT